MPVESYGTCRHQSAEGLDYWQKVGRLHEANAKPDDETYPPLRACRRHRLILAEAHEHVTSWARDLAWPRRMST